MPVPNFDPTMITALLPEIGLLVLAGLVLLFDLLWPEERRRALGWLTFVGLVVLIAAALVFSRPDGNNRLIWGGMLRQDWLGFVFSLLFLSGAALTALFAMDSPTIGQRGEFYLLMLAATLGMLLMASSADLVMLYLAIETTSIPLYALAGFLTRQEKSSEAGLKYILFGAMTSAVMLYGFSLLYGFTGTTQIYTLAARLQSGDLSVATLIGVGLLVLVGFGFKVSAVPFHFWAPDVYEGAPTPAAGFISTASKAAGFAVLLRFLLAVFPAELPYWTMAVAMISAITMVVGNFVALTQRNIKRLLAYSSIAHAGYILIGVAASSAFGTSSAVFYLIAYLLTNLAAFGVVAVAGKALGSDEISAYSGLSRRSPGLALALLAALLSLGGIPPFGGFVGKVLVIASAVNAGLVWLAFLAILNSIVGLYYYLNVLKVVYLYRSEGDEQPLPLTRPWSIALVVCVAGILLLGTFFAPWYNWSMTAAAGLF